MKASRLKSTLIALAVLLVVASSAGAQDQKSPYDEDVLKEARHIYNNIMSPYCPGLTLANCGSGAADILRATIRERLAAGETQDEIMASLVEEFGEEVRAEPPKSGFASLVWLGPIVLLLFGAGVITVYVRRSTARRAGPSGDGDAEIRARVEEELKSHKT